MSARVCDLPSWQYEAPNVPRGYESQRWYRRHALHFSAMAEVHVFRDAAFPDRIDLGVRSQSSSCSAYASIYLTVAEAMVLRDALADAIADVQHEQAAKSASTEPAEVAP